MPEALERKAKATARKKFPHNKKRQARYVYGTLRKTGWKPSHQKNDTSTEMLGPVKAEVHRIVEGETMSYPCDPQQKFAREWDAAFDEPMKEDPAARKQGVGGNPGHDY